MFTTSAAPFSNWRLCFPPAFLPHGDGKPWWGSAWWCSIRAPCRRTDCDDEKCLRLSHSDPWYGWGPL